MILSQASRNLLQRLAQAGGSLECKGNLREGNALERRKFVKAKQGRFVLTAAGRKWLDKN